MSTHRISLDEAPGFVDTKLRAAIREGAIKGLLSAALKGVSEIQTRIIPGMVREPADRSIYKAGWRAEQDGEDALIINRVPHAVFIEHGVRGSGIKVGRRMIGALAEWATRKGVVRQGKSPQSMAWAIAMRMASNVTVKRGGFPTNLRGHGAGIFGPSGLQVLAKLEPLLPKMLRDEVAREVERALGK